MANVYVATALLIWWHLVPSQRPYLVCQILQLPRHLWVASGLLVTANVFTGVIAPETPWRPITYSMQPHQNLFPRICSSSSQIWGAFSTRIQARSSSGLITRRDCRCFAVRTRDLVSQASPPPPPPHPSQKISPSNNQERRSLPTQPFLHIMWCLFTFSFTFSVCSAAQKHWATFSVLLAPSGALCIALCHYSSDAPPHFAFDEPTQKAD